MRFDWDPIKNEKNIAKHRIDFMTAVTMFAGPVLIRQSDRDSEERHVAIGVLKGVWIAVVFTDRQTDKGATRRIISARRARKNEIEAYHEARRS